MILDLIWTAPYLKDRLTGLQNQGLVGEGRPHAGAEGSTSQRGSADSKKQRVRRLHEGKSEGQKKRAGEKDWGEEFSQETNSSNREWEAKGNRPEDRGVNGAKKPPYNMAARCRGSQRWNPSHPGTEPSKILRKDTLLERGELRKESTNKLLEQASQKKRGRGKTLPIKEQLPPLIGMS